MNNSLFHLYKNAVQLALPLILLSFLIQIISITITEVDPMLPIYFSWAYAAMYAVLYVPMITLSQEAVRLDTVKTIAQLFLTLFVLSSVGSTSFLVMLSIVDYFPPLDLYMIWGQLWHHLIMTAIVVTVATLLQRFFRRPT